MTEQKQLHEGEIWRKQGPFDWCRIDRNETPEATDYVGGLPGFAVSTGKFSFKRKRVYWCFLKWFVAASNYDAFVMQMEVEQRYLMHGEVKEQRNEL